MRPVELTIAGLQSYREPQKVEFDKLLGAGVFGIFGPTGSGKSTILDAMTLALFGEVGRASKGTHGILNHAESALSVSFTFELNGGGRTERYCVERQYKRERDHGVKSTVVRLSRLEPDGRKTVLADKAREVNAGVMDILGLTMSDFTRAVVLPQGKFAEFLQLTGADRRQMLQRLFHLHPYGDGLAARLKERSQEAETRLRELAAESQALGDASEEAVAAAAERLQAAKREEAEARTAAAAAEKAYRAGSEAWERRRRLEEARRQLEELTAREPAMREIEAELARAESAELLQPDWRERLEAAAAREAAEQAAREAAADHAGAAAAEQSARMEREAARALAADALPQLNRRLGELEKAVACRGELLRLRAEAAELKRQADEAAGEAERNRASLQAERAKRERALVLQSELKAELASLAVPPEERDRLGRALLALERRERLAAEAAAAESEVAAKRQAVEALEAEEASRNRSLASLGSAWADRLREADALKRELAAIIRDAEEAESRLRERETRIRELQRAEEQSRLAVRLAEHLTEGEPCPVCGSLHHPSPAAWEEPAGVSAAALEAEWTAAQQGLERLRALVGEARERQYPFASLLRELGERLPEPVREAWSQAAAAAGGGAEPGALAASTAGELSPDPDPDALAERLRLWRSRWDDFAAAAAQLRTESDRLAREREAASARLQAARSVYEERAAYAAERLALAAEAERDWALQWPELDAAGVRGAWETLAARDRQTEKLRERIANSEPYLRKVEEDIAAFEERLAESERRRLQASTLLDARNERLAELAEELARLAGEEAEDPERALSATAERIRLISEREQAAEQAAEAARVDLHRAASRLAVAEQALTAAADRLRRAEERWASALARSPFATGEEAQAAWLPEEARAERRRALDDYRVRLDAARARHGQLAEMTAADPAVTDEQLEELRVQYEEAGQALERALAARAKNERDLESCAERHRLWKELQQRIALQQEQTSRLQRLAQVLRGNAFVEFIAEEQLAHVSRSASERLAYLTRGRYALEIDSSGGFLIRDDANGGVKRPVSSLSGGETFLTSLSLALALSAQIQLRGRHPLQFFFLDEGFGTLDPELLDTVITALETLQSDSMAVGVISHVPELRSRLARRLIVHPAEPSGRGSRLVLETL